MLKDWRVAVFLALTLAFTIWIQWWASLGFPLEYEICSEPKSSEDCGSYNVIFYSAWALAKAIDHYSALITAIATAFVAWFTWTLYRSSEKMWGVTKIAADAAQKSAEVSERALVDLERAYIFVDKIDSNVGEFFAPNLAWTDGKHFPIFTLSTINLGRTPGNIEFAVIYFDVFSQIPDEITQLHMVTANPHAESVEIIIGPDRPFKFPESICTNGFTHAHVREMRASTSHLYCHGLFTYRDIFNNSHTTKFCRRYVPGRDEWPPEGGREREIRAISAPACRSRFSEFALFLSSTG